jgi:anion-transporting  ArsA/GET3 family ATPase
VSPAARAPRRPATSRPAPTLVDRLESLEVIVCCGSGGVGKTTVSAALGLALTQRSDRRVLVLTVDPARRLATALGLREIGTEPVTVSRARLRRAGIDSKGHLVAAMLDMKSTFDQMVTRMAPTRRDAQRILDNRFYKGISDSFVGSHEYMAMEALYELHTAGEYDTVIIDTPPSRNALDFLEAPNRLTDFVGAKMLGWLSSGPSRFGMRAVNVAAAPFLRIADRLVGADVLKEVAEFVTDLQKIYGGVQQRARDVYTLLRSPRVGFVVVTTLEPAPFGEAEYFCARLREYRMPLRGVVVNRVLPDSLRDPASLATARTLADDDRFPGWLSQKVGHRVQPNALHAIGERWLQLHGIAERDARQLGRLERLGDVEARRVPLFSEDVSELEGLARIAALL